ncbi:type II toxin-antitoxin system toxin DNA ADP-ribosyl transferase DarT [Zhaonella formicivorans]|uniref:type II toxin-antitoxin system toxin DNA ADP-ribosyl transferase DarT n=1 Tax=Zhaonella formicivorans TaxID=2528593 RepID=UPI001D12D043|nr:DUF4433 domain-containing protein [Zhaonella formicivorans]
MPSKKDVVCVVPVPTNIYHITHIDNLPSIIEKGGLFACSSGATDRHVNIAHRSIQDRRHIFPVPLPPYGAVHDYVPFYFAPRSPMLYSIYRGNVDGYGGGQHPIVYLVSTVQKVEEAGLPFVFTDGHAIMYLSNYYNNISDLCKIDWEIMRAKFWADTEDDNDKCRRRQAEFLVYKFFPWSLISGIAVYDEKIAEQVGKMLQNGEVTTKIRVKREWYY